MNSFLSGAEVTPLAVVSDSSFNEDVTLGIIKSFISRHDSVVFACWRKSPEFYMEHIGLDCAQRINFLDGFTDPFDWALLSRTHASSSKITLHSDLLGIICASLSKAAGSKCVLIDDLDLLLRKKLLYEVCHLLKGLSHAANQVLVFVHPLVSDAVKLRNISHISSSFVEISPPEQGGGDGVVLVRCLLKKKTRKPVSETALVSVRNGKLDVRPLSRGGQTVLEPKREVDPSANLTFNLRLSAVEKQARASTTLPYLLDAKTKEQSLASVSTRRQSAEIQYEPDEADDFDEEDPDYDLDV